MHTIPMKTLRTACLSCLSACLSASLLATLVWGCGATPRPSCNLPEDAALSIAGTDRVNPDTQGRSLPTIVRVFQLNGLGSLENATFQELWQSPEDTLGEPLISMDEVTYYPAPPGSREPPPVVHRAFERDPAANFIVGMAIVRRPAGVSWRSVIELPVPATQLACAAQQADPEEPPPAPEIAQIRFELDDYRIEGFLTMAPPTSDCALGDLGCARDAARDAEPEADPETPETPESPELPSAKS